MLNAKEKLNSVITDEILGRETMNVKCPFFLPWLVLSFIWGPVKLFTPSPMILQASIYEVIPGQRHYAQGQTRGWRSASKRAPCSCFFFSLLSSQFSVWHQFRSHCRGLTSCTARWFHTGLCPHTWFHLSPVCVTLDGCCSKVTLRLRFSITWTMFESSENEWGLKMSEWCRLSK